MQSAQASWDGTSFGALVIRMLNELDDTLTKTFGPACTVESSTRHLHIAILYR